MSDSAWNSSSTVGQVSSGTLNRAVTVRASWQSSSWRGLPPGYFRVIQPKGYRQIDFRSPMLIEQIFFVLPFCAAVSAVFTMLYITDLRSWTILGVLAWLATTSITFAIARKILREKWNNPRVKAAILQSLDYQNPGDTIESLYRQAMEAGVTPIVRSVACELIRNGHAGAFVHIVPDLSGECPEPFTVPFEPMRMDTADLRVAALTAGRSKGSDSTPRLLGTRAIMWLRVLSGEIHWLPYCLLAVTMIYFSNITVSSSGFPYASYLTMSLYIALIIDYYRQTSRHRRRQRFLAPQRLILRPKRPGKSARLLCFDRNDCIVVARALHSRMISVYIINEIKGHRMLLHPREFELFASAWLSPVTPPPADRMGDLE